MHDHVVRSPEDKREMLSRLRKLVTSPTAVGSSSAALNLSDMYLNMKDRAQVLEVLKDRYPHALGQMDIGDPDVWMERLQRLSSTKPYVSAYAGESGELASIETLRESGIEAIQFTSKVHAANDLDALAGADYSVKSYAADNTSKFLGLVEDTPDSSQYVVNTELFEALQERGEIETLAAKGIAVIDGRFLHEAHVQKAECVLQKIRAGEDGVADGLFDDISVVGVVVVLGSVAYTLHQYRSGRLSEMESMLDVARSLTRVGAGGAGAAAGTAVGAAIGSAVFPLLGTLIGGTVGGVLGAMGAGGALRHAADRMKWGEALDAFHHLGQRYEDGLSSAMVDNVSTRIFRRPSLDEAIAKEQLLRTRFAAELDEQDSTPPSVAAVLSDVTLQRISQARESAARATGEVADAIIQCCVEWGISKYPRQRKSARDAALTMYGAFLVETDVLYTGLDGSSRYMADSARFTVAEAPNHPFRTQTTKDEILQALALNCLAQQGARDE